MSVSEVRETTTSSTGSASSQAPTAPSTSSSSSAAAARSASGSTSSATAVAESDGFVASDEDDDDFSTGQFGGGDFTEGAEEHVAPPSSPDSDTSSTDPNSDAGDSKPPLTPEEIERLGAEGPKQSMPANDTKPTDFNERHKALDKDGDGKVTREDMGLDEEAFAKIDADGNGKVSKDEFRADFHRQNSFENLDSDKDGKLSAQEMEKLERFGSADYDRNGDGVVDTREFVAGRKDEMRSAREARIEDRINGLEGDDLEKKLEKFDADGDGKLTVDEVMAGRREARDKQRNEHSDKLFSALSAGGDGISVETHEEYKGYDADRNGTVSAEEFKAGQADDWARLRDRRYIDGGAAPDARERLGVDAAGQMKATSTAAPINVGNINNLSYDQVCELIKSQGGELFENGQPSILALRTENAGTSTYDDVFVVVKPNGEMQAFAGTTRPTSTTPNNGYNPGMVLPGNYQLAPRPASMGTWDNAFFVQDTSGNNAVPTAVDSNGDGQYSESELGSVVMDDEIRMHPGNSTTTSSAGCFNVQDYDAFLAYLGGHGNTYNMTVVNV